MTTSLLQFPASAADLVGPAVPAEFSAALEPLTVDFDGTANEEAWFFAQMPGHYVKDDPISFIMPFRPQTGVGGDFVFRVKIARLNYLDADYNSPTFGASQDVSITNDHTPQSSTKVMNIHLDVLSGEMLYVAPNENIIISIERRATDASDTLTDDIQILGVHIITDLFDPTTFDTVGANLQFCHDARIAADFTLSGSDITTWRDTTANNVDLTSPNSPPVFNDSAVGTRPGAVFADDDLTASQNFVIDGPWTYIAILQHNGVAHGFFSELGIADVFSVRISHNTPDEVSLEELNNNTVSTAIALAIDVPHVVIVTKNTNGSWTLIVDNDWNNRESIISQSIVATGPKDYFLGVFDSDTAGESWQVGWAAMYDVEFDQDQVQAMSCALAAEFDVALPFVVPEE